MAEINWDRDRTDFGETGNTLSATAEMAYIDARTGLVAAVVEPDETGLAPWRTLNAESLSPAPFYDPVFLRAIAEGGSDGDFKILTVRDPQNGDALKAIWPFSLRASGPVAQLQSCVTISNHYAPVAVPIVARDDPEAILTAALGGFAALAPVLTIPNLPLENPVAEALYTAIERGGFSSTVTGKTSRAAFRGGMIFRDYVSTHWSRNRRNMVRRFERKLADAGTVSYRTASAAAPWREAGELFLDMESRGWKGRAGTAMAAQQHSRRIVGEIADRMVPSGLAEIHALLLDDRPIAMLILLRLRGQVMAWKTTYDEGFAKVSPGQLLFAEVTQKMIGRGDQFADSCATDGHSIADAFWGDRMTVGTLHIGLNQGAAGMLGLGLSAAHAAAFDVARNTYRALKRTRRIAAQSR